MSESWETIKRSVHFSSLSDHWRTPESVLALLREEFNFDFDPCPVSPTFDGLNVPWGSCSFVNPPYSQLAQWLKKGYEEHQLGKTAVFLIPSRTDTKAWHDYVMKATEIRFVKGRLKFSGSKNSAPFPSAIVIFSADTE